MHGLTLKRSDLAIAIGAVAIAFPALVFADRTPTNNKTFVYSVGL